ncbi:Hypp5483 [Branchiostoma lanceolatum]|uniref:Hypp5483 protein n=1 Tax=Branchiostoma lanceolatum TaxID=7740 RepID=A0A8J9VDT6_BRALA|nr:Hypp5483 [Branchiostoma lanceolatum]
MSAERSTDVDQVTTASTASQQSQAPSTLVTTSRALSTEVTTSKASSAEVTTSRAPSTEVTTSRALSTEVTTSRAPSTETHHRCWPTNNDLYSWCFFDNNRRPFDYVRSNFHTDIPNTRFSGGHQLDTTHNSSKDSGAIHCTLHINATSNCSYIYLIYFANNSGGAANIYFDRSNRSYHCN